MNQYRVLTEAQVRSFLDDGYLVVKDCLDLDVANRWSEEAYDRLGYDKDDPSTWVKDIVWMDHQNQLPVSEIAPKAWDAILNVVGGEDRLETRVMRLRTIVAISPPSTPSSGPTPSLSTFGAARTSPGSYHRPNRLAGTKMEATSGTSSTAGSRPC